MVSDGMNHFEKFRQQLSNLIFLAIFLPAFSCFFTYIFLNEMLQLPLWLSIGASVAVLAILTAIMYRFAYKTAKDPVEKIWQALLHISPNRSNEPAPQVNKMGLGRELISSIVLQIYDLAGGPSVISGTSKPIANPEAILPNLPTPLFILDKNQKISQINQTASQYLHSTPGELIGKNIYDVLHLSFKNEDTFDKWLAYVSEARVTDAKTWEQVRMNLDDGKTLRQFDLAASFSKDDPSGNEIVLVLFDKSEAYKEEDDGLAFVAMAVHELRTPLTVMRGYIEVFEEELSGSLSPEHLEFMRKLSASSQSLTAFVGNILNVAKIDENQLVLSLQESKWEDVLKEIVKDLELRTSVRGKHIKLEIPGNLPTVAIDKISMYEVIGNLVDNAIKYSGTSKEIIIRCKDTKQGTVETQVQDFGIGIPVSTIKNLFTRYYRSHHSRGAVGGSGLGLYIVRSLIEAHGGNVWVDSQEGQGSTFSFTLQTYQSASNTVKPSPAGIERHASGWIKNHTLYRR